MLFDGGEVPAFVSSEKNKMAPFFSHNSCRYGGIRVHANHYSAARSCKQKRRLFSHACATSAASSMQQRDAINLFA